MSFQQGLSGLNAAAKSLEVIGNNVANSSTVGFKQGQAQFADMYANSMNRSGNSPVGIGVGVANVAQQFTQGNISSSNNPLDVAINGDGFFRMVGSLTNAAPLYGRNGQFQINDDGYIINPSENGAYLTGWPGTVTGGDPVPLKIDTSNIPATETTGVKTKLNLDSRLAAPVTAPFAANEPTSYNSSTGVTVFDSLGNTYNVQTYYVKNTTTSTATTTDWDVYTTVDGMPTPAFTPPATQGKAGTLTFDDTGLLTASTATNLDLTAFAKPGASFKAAGISLDYTGTTQTGAAFVPIAQSQDGMAPGVLSGFSIGKDGRIIGSYSNSETRTLGQVLLVNFVNPNGLQPLGNNLYAATADAGEPLIGTPTNGSFGTLQSRAVEDSNVDLTAELVNMITAQRAYQANAQTIKTQDQIMQTLINLR